LLIEKKIRFGLRNKAFIYITRNDDKKLFIKFFLKNFLKNTYFYLRSRLKKQPFHKKDDFFFYGIKNKKEFNSNLNQPNTILILGFSYCQKPHNCPMKRFSTKCIHTPNNNICRECTIGKCINTYSSNKIIPLIITTIHMLGENLLLQIKEHSSKKVLFLITSCEMSLNMFADFANMLNVKGIGVRLKGRVCKNFTTFKFAENGIKSGLTSIDTETEKKILYLLKQTIPYKKKIEKNKLIDNSCLKI
jgi:hypothetical protein